MPEPHLAINGYFLDQPHSGSGQYLLRLLEEIEALWAGPITVFVPSHNFMANFGRRLVAARYRGMTSRRGAATPSHDREGVPTGAQFCAASSAESRPTVPNVIDGSPTKEGRPKQSGEAGDSGATSSPPPQIATSPAPPPPLLRLLAMTGRLGGRDDHVIAREAERRGRSLHPIPVPLPGPLGKVWFEQIGVPRDAHAAGAGLLHVPYFGAPVSCPVPVVVTVHDLIQLVIPRLRGGPLNRAYNLLAAVGARRAAAVITDSTHVRADVLRRLHVAPDRVFPIHLAVDARFHPVRDQEEEAALRSHHSLNGPFILYAGGIDWRKNVPLLIRSYARSGVIIPLVIAGEARSTRTSSFPDLREEARQAGVTDRVRFIPMEEDSKPALYRAAALYVCPSLAEGFGLTPLEALACGTPVICSNATSLPEVVGDAALLFDPSDEEGLSRLITRIFTEEGLTDRLRAAGPQQAKRFSWRTTAEQTMAVYHDVLTTYHESEPRP